MRHSTIQIEKNTVTKTAAPDLMRVEVEKTRMAFEIGRDCGLFSVPKVLDYNEAKGVAVFERIERIQPFISRINQCSSIIERIGRSLAIIHRMLSLPQKMVIPLPPELVLPGTEVFLHGDFNGCNVCFRACSDSIVIFDWQMTSQHGGQATYGSRYFDLLWFVNHMLWMPTVTYLFRDPVAPVAKSFLESYFREAEIPYDADMLVQYAKDFFAVKLPFRKQDAPLSTIYLLPRSRVLTQRFIESLKMLDLEEQISSSRGESPDR